VKVQHPGIENALKGDLSNLALMQSLVSAFLPKGLDSRAMIAEISDRFREELDYLGEAKRTQAFHDFFERTPQLLVPKVISDRSTRRVLTTTFLKGAHLDEASSCQPDLRQAYARHLWHFVFRGNLVGGAFQADPHPGNYLFGPDGTVSCLDFGCVQPIFESTRVAVIEMHDAAVAREDARFQKALREMLGTRGGAYERATGQFIRSCFEPIFASPFHLSRDYVRRLTGSVAGMRKEMFSKDGSFVSPPPHLAMMNRLQFGFYSVLARLDVTVDYAAVDAPIVEEARETRVGIISNRLATSQG